MMLMMTRREDDSLETFCLQHILLHRRRRCLHHLIFFPFPNMQTYTLGFGMMMVCFLGDDDDDDPSGDARVLVTLTQTELYI